MFRLFKDEKGFTTQEIATGMTMAILVAAVAVVTGHTIISDTEENSHITNAKAFASAAGHSFSVENNGPELDEDTFIYSLQDLYDRDRLAPLQDPSEDGDTMYDASASKVKVENVSPSGNERQIFQMFVQLVRASDGYVYVNEITDSGVEAEDLTRADVSIPRRNDTLATNSESGSLPISPED
jgi:hypothetical protein